METSTNLRYREKTPVYAIYDANIREFYVMRFLSVPDAELAANDACEIVTVNSPRYAQLRKLANVAEKTRSIPFVKNVENAYCSMAENEPSSRNTNEKET